ncbi:MAG TPA: M48 family metallopeptidase [Bacteroidales bacterium]|nr:M48 family metallopeptidase [Bacteroidales bacterium]
MHRNIFLFIMGLFLIVPVFGQNNFSNFTSLKSEGKIPPDFRKYITSESKEDLLLKRLFTSGLILYGTELNQYVNKVADQVLKDHPDLRKEMRFYILRSSAVNAFAFSDHLILINLGLLAQIQNESELAFIISHELIHIVNKHIEKEKTEKRRKKDKVNYNSKKDQYLVYHNRSREHEYESDKEGFTKFFEKSGYNIEDIDGVYDVLQYGYLPFEETKLDRGFLETDFYKFPDSYFLVNLTPIRNREDYIDTLSTHPNILKRRTIMSDLVENSSHKGGASFIQPESLFLRIRTLARFECINLLLTTHDYGESFFNSYVLQKEFPNNEFLEQAIVASLYGISKHKLSEGISEIIGSYKDFEGEIQQIMHFFTRYNKDESTILALRFAWDASNKYPENTYFPLIVNDLIKSLLNRKKLNYTDYSDYPMGYDVSLIPADTISTDSTTTTQTGKNRFGKIKSTTKKTKVKPTETFKTQNYMLVDLRKDTTFMNLVEQNLKNVEDKEILDVIDENKFDDKVCNSLIVWYPNYYIQKSSNKIEMNNQKIEKMVTQSIKNLNVEAQTVYDLPIENFSTERYNQYCKIQNFYYEYNYSSGIPMIYYESNHIEDACLEFGGTCINFVNVYSKRSSSIYLLYFWFIPPTYPILLFAPQMFVHSLLPTKDTQTEYVIINLSTGEQIVQKSAYIEGRNNTPAINVFINRMFYNYSPKKVNNK